MIDTVNGNTPDSGLSVITEKIEILNNSASDVTLDLIGMGMQASASPGRRDRPFFSRH